VLRRPGLFKTIVQPVGRAENPSIFIAGEVVGGDMLGDDAAHRGGWIVANPTLARAKPEEAYDTLEFLFLGQGLVGPACAKLAHVQNVYKNSFALFPQDKLMETKEIYLVEAAGVEPASETVVSRENPCSVQFRMYSPPALRTDKMRRKLVRLISLEAARTEPLKPAY